MSLKNFFLIKCLVFDVLFDFDAYYDHGVDDSGAVATMERCDHGCQGFSLIF